MSNVQEPLPGGFVVENDAHEIHGSKAQLSSRQEAKLIHYLDQQLLDISRLYKRRAVEDSDQAVAAEALDQLLVEVAKVLTILAQVPPGSASIAVAYALNILDIVSDYIRVFRRSPGTTFKTLKQLDDLFVELLKHRSVNVTEQTRLSGLAARLRNIVYTKYEGTDEYETQCSQVMEGSIDLI